MLTALFLIRCKFPIRPATQSEINIEPSQDSLLDLGDDRMDYKLSSISKHHQRYESLKNLVRHLLLFLCRRKYVTGVNSISTRSYLK